MVIKITEEDIPPPPPPAAKAEYYSQGSKEIATETPVTFRKLETRRKLTKNSNRLVIALVGLPARGKSFVARKLLHYLNWSGVKCKIFNVGRYRREAYRHQPRESKDKRAEIGACDADFFNSENETAARLREQVAQIALDDMLKWLDDEDLGGSQSPDSSRSSGSSSPELPQDFGDLMHTDHERIAIFDATNSTAQRREWILEQCTANKGREGKTTGVIFVESICDDQELIEENFRFKISNSPDFDGMSDQEALEDLRRRVKNYEDRYETITDDSLSYVKIFNLSTKLMVNHIYGRMAKELVPALMSWHIGTRPVFLCRPGQTTTGVLTDCEDYPNPANQLDAYDPKLLDLSSKTRRKTLRGDKLGPNGERFRSELLDYCYEESLDFMKRRASVHDMAFTGTSISGAEPAFGYEGSNEPLDSKEHFPIRVFASTMPRAAETVAWRGIPVQQMSNLNPLDKGDFAGMEMEEIKYADPAWYARLEQDAYRTRFPGGESYADLVRRLSSVIIDVEQQVTPTLVVSHLSILQCLMAYFRNTPVEECGRIKIPMHTIIKFTPVRGGGWSETHHPMFGSEHYGRGMIPVSSESEFSQVTFSGNESLKKPIWDDQGNASSSTLLPKSKSSPKPAAGGGLPLSPHSRKSLLHSNKEGPPLTF